MILYHGTDQPSAIKIVSSIDVTLGGGELGMGFYAGGDIALAAAISIGGKGLSKAKVVKLDIDDIQLVKLKFYTFHTRKSVYAHWKKLQRSRNTRNYIFDVDVVVGPFATIEFSYQYKFESKDSEIVLNRHTFKSIL